MRESLDTCETWNKLAHTFSHRYETSGTLKIHPLCDRSACLCASSPTLTHSACAKPVPREPAKPQLCDFCHFLPLIQRAFTRVCCAVLSILVERAVSLSSLGVNLCGVTKFEKSMYILKNKGSLLSPTIPVGTFNIDGIVPKCFFIVQKCSLDY